MKSKMKKAFGAKMRQTLIDQQAAKDIALKAKKVADDSTFDEESPASILKRKKPLDKSKVNTDT
jgi:hypothetical protein